MMKGGFNNWRMRSGSIHGNYVDDNGIWYQACVMEIEGTELYFATVSKRYSSANMGMWNELMADELDTLYKALEAVENVELS